VHHYQEFMEVAGFQQAVENVGSLVEQYREMDGERGALAGDLLSCPLQPGPQRGSRGLRYL
jgi:hypothetical protein